MTQSRSTRWLNLFNKRSLHSILFSTKVGSEVCPREEVKATTIVRTEVEDQTKVIKTPILSTVPNLNSPPESVGAAKGDNRQSHPRFHVTCFS